jgi:hypothetical protein
VVPAFTDRELGLALIGAAVVEVLFFVLIMAFTNRASIRPDEESISKPIPIRVNPVIDDLPLLKLGSNKKVRAKLPDMWKKQAPVQRMKEASAPSPHAPDRVDAIPTSSVAKGDAAAPPPDAEVVKQADELLAPDASTLDAASNMEGEGNPGGVKEGTETDPLKARWVSEYQMKIQAWFSARFTPPADGAPCDELKKLRCGVAANVGPDRAVAGYSITRPSGNATFDAKVKATMDSIVGQQLPPPPPLYPDILGTTVLPLFSGANSPCKSEPLKPEPPKSEPPP